MFSNIICPSMNAATVLYDTHWCQYKEILSPKGIGLAGLNQKSLSTKNSSACIPFILVFL